ncbi:hypothetical protein SAMN05444369_11032 [Capnocytophaga haemolytica]|uniref:Uncharacterized protein n=1 Tax=Capnocytophaga haemolytica TaxID=45243 RepID=A0AAX2GUA5_9FLAO|nr:hypothetical protein [Capnocytophaga haemolytica]AMD85430.1 hypothetical protein AXF12_07835 [Capnocytophaga haemolytica]SFO12490.1 hypothetical protein SAMN05444369_11032 [Capnocytophaga haemolytica]SNV01698.1 Uncharacterised protein [Capnocytophaga haemolytica]
MTDKPTTTTKTQNALSFIAKNKMTILVSAAVLAGVFVVYKVAKRFAGSDDDDHVKGTGSDLDKSKATITEAQSKNYAEQLLDAMNAAYPLWGTDEKTILAVFNQLKNKHDFLMVYHAFGLRDYNGYNSPPKSFWKYLDVYQKRDLVYWLKSELSPSDGEVYKRVKKVVEGSGFTF